MAEEDNSNVHSSNEDPEEEWTSSGTNDFCVLSTDDIHDDIVSLSSRNSPPEVAQYQPLPSTSSVDSLEEIKRKAQEIADSLQKVRNKSSKSTTNVSQAFELPEDLKRHRERSLYVAKKLQEDKMLFEESKKRNETVFDKVRLAKRIQQNITENVKELKREDGDESAALKLKIERLESTISHLKESLATKNRIISEKNETIRTLNQTVTDTYEAHQRSLEQSSEEMTNVKNEYTKTIEAISNSKDEAYSQLQIMRKKYLALENDLKLSDFARCRLVSRNAELRERINQLENDNEQMATKINENTSLEGMVQDTKNFSDETDINVDEFRPKIENLVVIANEFQSLLADDDYAETDELNFDEDDNLSQIIDQIGDHLESTFYAFRDKLASIPKSLNETQKLKDQLAHLNCVNSEAKDIEARLQDQVAALHLRLTTESRHFDDLKRKYEDFARENEQLRIQLNEIRGTVLADSKKTVDELQNECCRLQNECHQLQNELETRMKERNEANFRLASLQSEYEELRRTNESSHSQSEFEILSKDYENLYSLYQAMLEELATKNREYETLKSKLERQSQEEKYENDFVVLQKRDYDEEEETLKQNYARLCQDNEKLMESVRVMSERAIEHENDKLEFSEQYRQLQGTVEHLQTELESATKENEKEEEIEGLQNEMSKLLLELNKVWDQLHDEKSTSHELQQQLTYSEEMNAKLSNEVRELRERCRTTRPEVVHELEMQNQRLQDGMETVTTVQLELDQTKNILKRLWELVDQSSCPYDRLEGIYDKVKDVLANREYDAKEIEKLNTKINSIETEKHSLLQEIEMLRQSNAQLQTSLEQQVDDYKKQLMQINGELMFQNNRTQSVAEELTQQLQERDVILGELNLKLETAREHLRQSENATHELVTNCTSEVDNLREAIVELKVENQSLQSKCESYYTKYVDLFAHVNEIVARAKNTSDEAIRIITKLQTRWNLRKDDVGCQYDEGMAAAWANDIYEHGRQVQTDTYEGLLDEMRMELNSLQSQYACAKEQLLIKDDECNAEVARYEEVLTQLRSQFNEIRNRLTVAEQDLVEKDKFINQLEQSQLQENVKTESLTSDTEETASTAGLVSFFKDKMTKSIADMLHSEETTDYSQWILPEADSEFRTQRPSQHPSTVITAREDDENIVVHEPLALSDVLDKVKGLIFGRNDPSGWDVDEGDWSGSQLDVTHDEFVNVGLKFVDLFDAVYKYYSNIPQAEAVLNHLRNIIQPEQQETVSKNYKDMFEQLVNLTTYLENENKCLLDIVKFLEDLLISRKCQIEFPRIFNIMQECRRLRGIDEMDIVDSVCEEYDIVPKKFVPEESLTQWRENMAKLVDTLCSTTEKTSIDIETILGHFEMLRTKVRKLICDLHDGTRQNTFDPVKYFEQIEDISHRVENSVRLMQGKDVKKFDHEAEEHGHSEEHHHHNDEHQHDDDEHHHKEKSHSHEDENALQNETNQLKLLLAESNKKIGSLVTELMEVKNSREYNEVKQLHTKLDETLYQLHLRDVHVVELTRELTQLLSERDELQLKLSNIIRQNEQLRESRVHQGVESIRPADLENKLEELQTVNYMKDPRILETSKQYHATEMQLFKENSNSASRRERTESGGFSVPSLIKWITGDNETD